MNCNKKSACRKQALLKMKTGNYLILRDEREVPKTADTRCFAAREE
jgi:hypothetical protein